MASMGAFFRWDTFITPTVVKTFYWLNIVLLIVIALFGLMTSLAFMQWSPSLGLLYLLITVIGVLIGIIVVRIFAEMVLIFFKMHDHLDAMRKRMEQ